MLTPRWRRWPEIYCSFIYRWNVGIQELSLPDFRKCPSVSYRIPVKTVAEASRSCRGLPQSFPRHIPSKSQYHRLMYNAGYGKGHNASVRQNDPVKPLNRHHTYTPNPIRLLHGPTPSHERISSPVSSFPTLLCFYDDLAYGKISFQDLPSSDFQKKRFTLPVGVITARIIYQEWLMGCEWRHAQQIVH